MNEPDFWEWPFDRRAASDWLLSDLQARFIKSFFRTTIQAALAAERERLAKEVEALIQPGYSTDHNAALSKVLALLQAPDA